MSVFLAASGLYAPLAFASCGVVSYRAGDSAVVANAIGVTSWLKTPDQGEVVGFGTQNPSASDIYLTDAGVDFVQVGWYLGSAENLPYTSTPRIFVGENDPASIYREDLRPGALLSWSTYHTFKIIKGPGSFYNFYVDNAVTPPGLLNHNFLGHAAVNGEVDTACVRMASRAYRPAAPLHTLQNITSAGQFYFTDHYFTNDSHFISIAGGELSTNSAFGGNWG